MCTTPRQAVSHVQAFVYAVPSAWNADPLTELAGIYNIFSSH